MNTETYHVTSEELTTTDLSGKLLKFDVSGYTGKRYRFTPKAVKRDLLKKFQLPSTMVHGGEIDKIHPDYLKSYNKIFTEVESRLCKAPGHYLSRTDDGWICPHSAIFDCTNYIRKMQHELAIARDTLVEDKGEIFEGSKKHLQQPMKDENDNIVYHPTAGRPMTLWHDYMSADQKSMFEWSDEEWRNSLDTFRVTKSTFSSPASLAMLEGVSQIEKAEMAKQFNERIDIAIQQNNERLRVEFVEFCQNYVAKMYDYTHKVGLHDSKEGPKPKMFDSIVENIQVSCAMMTKLFVGDMDEKLKTAVEEAHRLTVYDASLLKDDEKLRTETADKLQGVLDRMSL